MKYKLKRPILVTSESPPIAELTFREEVCAGDMRGIDMKANLTWDEAMKVAARLSAQPEAIMNKMGIDDATEVATIVMGFINGGPQAGKTP